MNAQVVVKVAKTIVKVGGKLIVVAAPIISGLNQNKMIKETVAKEVAKQIDALNKQ